ncbi:branched-chain amino acid aminotransferase [Gemelliphila palaticanis]|uniref:branched-chain-amino-acid transaminase n=1 Tax=Gemelliphila palaticanis TaxID=81950 RepID=A0ABX2T4M4_9BACL|nr:branched-chain amino acid aminotransferase [Gemella palaticanis]MBF0716230.1 branched-chain amino acid aminotransferase [Gemella palaticanis]NYS48160.1 branched-chain amino acid aminotransferase [Gemella palaticanis]
MNLELKDIKINLTKNPKQKPEDDKLGFGAIFSDHMFIMDWNEEKGWYNPRIEEYAPIAMAPSLAALHYGQSIFEGMKAYIANGKPVLFRPRDNFERLNNSAERLALPKVDVDFALTALSELIKVDKEWIPTSEGTSLYIRPFMFGCDEYLGVKASSNVKFIIILSPSGAYFKGGLQPNKIFVEDEYVRAVRGGTGYAKAAGNYAGSLIGQNKAAKLGYAQTLWLDGVEQKYVEEVGAMNIFFKIDGKYITPELNGSILPGITRDSIIKLLKHNGEIVEERKLSINELYEAADNGKLEEVFGTGTAAVISPVGELFDGKKKIVINDFITGEAATKIYNQLTGIQLGKVEDPFGWLYEIK